MTLLTAMRTASQMRLRVDGGFEDVELAEEAGGDGQAEEREQEERENGGDDGLAFAEAGEVVELEVLFAGAAELGNDGEGADFYEGIAQQIKEDGGVGGAGADVIVFGRQIGDGGEGDQDVAGVGDRAIGQHALDVGLEKGAEIARKHSENGEDPESPEPEMSWRRERRRRCGGVRRRRRLWGRRRRAR